ETFMAKWTINIPESEIRRLLRFQGRYYFAGGKPGSLPIETFSQILRELLDDHEKKWNSDDPSLRFEVLEDYNYGETSGKRYLKEVLAKRLKDKENVDVIPDNVTITSGSQQAIYALLDCIISPGDFIVTPRPAYLGFLGPSVKLGATVVTVPTDLEGLIPEALEACIENLIHNYHRVPKIIYLVAYSDNPKGTTIPEKRKREIYNIAEQYNCLIVDDEAYKYIQYDSPDLKIQPLKAYDKENNRVAYLSTTSKEAAVFRLGYSVFPEPLQAQIVKAKGYLDLCTPTLLQRIAAIYYDKYIDEALKKTLAEYKVRRDAMIKGIENHFPEGTFTRPTGGFFVWWECRNRAFNSAKFMEEKVMKEGILYVPGNAFYPVDGLAYEDGKIVPNIIGSNGMRLGFSFKDADIINEGMEKLGGILTDHCKHSI
ncbi:MAG: PLP-dependent aminotransferase family protein, partial [Candidatus Hodarchaeota archaeon]